MDFIEYINTWVKSELIQGKIMIAFGVLILVVFISIIKSQNEFLRGALIPLGLLIFILIGYGSYILYSRSAHAKESIALFQESKTDGIVKEETKHINDNKAGKLLMRIYPILAIVAIATLFFRFSAYYRGMAIGFALLFLSFYVIDNGFVSRSDAFLDFLKTYSY
ncbi:hypothetical protein EYD45_04255 [Hyunsoonleella flava]|uniref:Uncharacterized protein n=1 Tax=Hyunsoonleella flava TaxID=2527939 RepID=A0A4Q9FFW2_9FLAO|nr:hypothetical protein [Hyunsoonleella flava]TBN05497.1 hypothetical protein EYD45_04255 [Hyunsoonleella flava]